MRELEFAYVGLGAHEEVVYSVAAELGYYNDEGLNVSIQDGVRWDDDRLRHAAAVGLGRTLLIRLLDGASWTMLCVNTERPSSPRRAAVAGSLATKAEVSTSANKAGR